MELETSSIQATMTFWHELIALHQCVMTAGHVLNSNVAEPLLAQQALRPNAHSLFRIASMLWRRDAQARVNPYLQLKGACASLASDESTSMRPVTLSGMITQDEDHSR